jgi:DNA-binding MarR family transcriptional regulator
LLAIKYDLTMTTSKPSRLPLNGAQAPRARDLLRLDHQLCFALYSSSLLMTKLYKPVLGALGLTYPQYLVLLVLWETDAIGVGQLGERLYLDSGTLTPLLKRMEAAGLLARERFADDERRVIVTLTAAGRRLRRKAETVPLQVACATGCKLDELTRVTAQLHSLRTNIAGQLDLAT